MNLEEAVARERVSKEKDSENKKLFKKMLHMIASESEAPSPSNDAPSSTGSEIIEQLKGKLKNQYQEMRAGINSDNFTTELE
jgi:Flp pilus assembly protein TadB